MYEMILGVPAFPCMYDMEEQEKNILESKFCLPSDLLSAEAMSLIKGLVVVEGRHRLTISQIKKHPFFKEVNWQQIERGEVIMPTIPIKSPDACNFDEITFDSCDEDW
jgi:serine/threonine protein kinase